MNTMSAFLVTALLGFTATVNAHMFISSPAPIPGSAPKDPLDASGSNFPCHGVALPSSGGLSMPAGSSQVLSWELGNGANTAVHGGGSCQISITYETDPAKVKDPSNWFVIYSIEGGCPSNTHQNLDGQYTGPQGSYSGALSCQDPKANGVDCVNQFNFSIPQGVKNGNAIMSWTWFNSVGNREMYQNCVNINLSGGDGSEMSELPTMFVANLGSVNQCPTTQSVDLLFPNPGKYVTTKKPSGAAASTAITFPMATPSGTGCNNDGGSGSGPAAQSSAAPAAPSSAAYSAPSAAQSASLSQATGAASSVAGNAAVTVTTMATITGQASYAPVASYAASSAAASSAAYSAPASGSGSSTPSGSCRNGALPCSSDGAVVCMGSQWGLCNHGCAVPEPLAPGTSCSNGLITRRSLKHAHRHFAGLRGY
ncbi:hypothetical protein BAUCODRAFT_216599 [Baudoinia panamericana UAMH 10762]|uniref:Lytic polysaccharide monooxygenase n=1 Tax=Baudoinia panamericana (strain UAMH 10762) TaxID=717646 RepID=M2N5B9_BAUPA|nr:uncharacterized protein BAUCODRAFT_216599 [Baudoinia panamericana UAMH 10762]EMC93960.1 hypothetical protein BAUCODRAFT_216599 [Baudoinia panamericana UAMH 10762]